MKEFDHTGLLLAEFQGKLFEKSAELKCSSAIFIRRFKNSELAELLDEANPALVPLEVNDGMNSINGKYKATDYGSEKYPAAALFWIGYFYRYVCYTRECSTKFAMKLFDYRKLKDVYYSFHTQDMEWCIDSMLQIYNLPKEIFDKNYRLKKIMEKTYLSNLNK